MTKIAAVLLGILFIATLPSDHENFPKPQGIKNMLFYLQRTFNKNTIIYQLNLNENNQINEQEPIISYWINYADKGDKEALNFIQRKYAYGLNVQKLDLERKTFSFNFVSYKKQIFYLLKSNDQKYHVASYFNNRLLILNHLYVHIEGGSFWTPKVKYIEVYGKDPLKNEEVIERVIP